MPTNPGQTKRFPRGARPTPRNLLAAAKPYVPAPEVQAPAAFLMWPIEMTYWNNSKYGDCTSAEEAFAKAAAPPKIFITEDALVSWAEVHGFLEGANLVEVMSAMRNDGIPIIDATVYDGPYQAVNWHDAMTLQTAIYQHGPVKIGIAADKLEDLGVTGGTSGWALHDYPEEPNEDHCVSLCGYGPLNELVNLFANHDVTVDVPRGMPTGMCYAMFTWNSIGILDEQSMLNMTHEAWIRDPVTYMETESFTPVSKIRLTNNGGFVVDIHTLYRSPSAPSYAEVANRDNFPICQTRTMDLNAKCPHIDKGDHVQIKVWVAWGADNTFNKIFLYDPAGPVQHFKISGSTLDNSVQYLGPESS